MMEKDLPLDELPPALAAVFDYWRNLGGETLGCRWLDFELYELPPEIVPAIMVADVKPDHHDNVFRFWGTEMTWIHGRDMTGKTISEITPPDLRETIEKNHAAMAEAPVASARVFGFAHHGGFGHLQSVLRLPLSDDGKSLSHIVIVAGLTNAGRARIEQQRREDSM